MLHIPVELTCLCICVLCVQAQNSCIIVLHIAVVLTCLCMLCIQVQNVKKEAEHLQMTIQMLHHSVAHYSGVDLSVSVSVVYSGSEYEEGGRAPAGDHTDVTSQCCTLQWC